jgi:hypothetical protein
LKKKNTPASAGFGGDRKRSKDTSSKDDVVNLLSDGDDDEIANMKAQEYESPAPEKKLRAKPSKVILFTYLCLD